jgi:Fe2+ or Zn2+ uptake regulation protein
MPKTAPHRDRSEPIEDERDLIGLLRARGQRVTSQRVVILRELRRLAQHATAEEIHRAVHRDLPGTSTPTVYATLDLLVELGLARRIDAGTGSLLYDARAEPHQHAVCRRCGQIQDLDGQLDGDRFRRLAAEQGFVAEGEELIVSGLCRRCAGASRGA